MMCGLSKRRGEQGLDADVVLEFATRTFAAGSALPRLNHHSVLFLRHTGL
jgi:hypothetical protein